MNEYYRGHRAHKRANVIGMMGAYIMTMTMTMKIVYFDI